MHCSNIEQSAERAHRELSGELGYGAAAPEVPHRRMAPRRCAPGATKHVYGRTRDYTVRATGIRYPNPQGIVGKCLPIQRITNSL